MKKQVIYDEKEMLAAEKVRSHGYHTKLKDGTVHPFRESIEYAVRLFDGGKDIERALKITERVIEKQEKNENSPFFGLWSYYLEEPLEKMSPPDFNWADFIGKQLLVIYVDYAKYLSEALKEKIRQSLSAACRCIMKRNVRVGYTNVAVMDSFLCAAAGELLECNELLDYGVQKLRRVLEFTRSDGNIGEYNSPVYTIVAMEDINWLLRYVKNADMRKDAEIFYGYLWESFAVSYHFKTGELSGPQSRNYTDFLTDEQKNIILCAAGLEKYDDDVPERDRLYVPDKLRDYFTKPRESYEFTRISNGSCYPCFANTKVAASYICENFSMGSFNHDEMWNQTRPFLGFFGTRDNKFAFKIQVLHDGYDFSDAEIHTAQYYGTAAGVVNFACDRGDTHICLDFIQNKTITARDLRVRFKICGNTGKLETENNSGELCVKYRGTSLRFAYAEAVFDGEKGRTELLKTDNELCFDMVLYCGKERKITFDFPYEKYCAFVIDINNDEKAAAKCRASNGRIRLDYKNLSVETQANSVPFTMLNVNDKILIDGADIEDMAVNKL